VVVLEVVFWLCVALVVWTQLGYALALAALARIRAIALPAQRKDSHRPPLNESVSNPHVTLIVAAHDEQDVIGAKVADALALDYPRELLQLIVACDGCTDATAERARDAGADLVLELPRAGKVRAQDSAV
jgi:cellulose synthase/poly-beta-1,6-N-acetylglucosamine synthase-like glycosyltransferase